MATKIKLFILLVAASLVAQAQEYPLLDTSSVAPLENLVDTYEANVQLYQDYLKNTQEKKLVKKLIEYHTDFSEGFVEEMKDEVFVFDTRFVEYAQGILKKLTDANPSIGEDYKLLISREPSLNAYCSPEGYVVLNMGMFYYLESESQIASVMAHELSHKILQHSLNRQIEQIKKAESQERKEKIKAIKKQKYNKNSSAFKLLKQNTYESSKKRRLNEFAADSLGYILYKNAQTYQNCDYVSALQLYTFYDTIRPQGLSTDMYKKLFDLPDQPFKEEWLQSEDYSIYDYSQYEHIFHKDSLATHPENQERISHLQNLFPELKQECELTPQSAELKELESVAFHAAVPNLYKLEAYGVALYSCMLAIQRDKSVDYFYPLLGDCFMKIYEAQKKYELNKYLDQLAPEDQSESYQQFLSFMWNLRLDEIKQIADYYKEYKAAPVVLSEKSKE